MLFGSVMIRKEAWREKNANKQTTRQINIPTCLAHTRSFFRIPILLFPKPKTQNQKFIFFIAELVDFDKLE